jgi:hypothetical protein
MTPDATLPAIVMTFPTLDQAESALDWIGLEFVEGEDPGGGWFAGELDEDAAERLAAISGDGDTPPEVQALAVILRQRWLDLAADRGWRVTFPRLPD